MLINMVSKNTINEIHRVISSLIEISDDEWEYYSSMFEIKEFKKKEILLQANTVCKEVYFVNKGLLRIFFIDKNGNESTFHFSQEHDFASDYESFLKKMPSNYYIQALENTQVVVMSQFMVNDGFTKLRKGEKLGRLLAEKYFFIFSNKIKGLYTLTPLERYQLMNKQFPGITQRVPQHFIASYLNVSSVHLSRLKNESL